MQREFKKCFEFSVWKQGVCGWRTGGGTSCFVLNLPFLDNIYLTVCILIPYVDH